MQEKEHLAIVIPHTDITLEMDLQDQLPSSVIHVERMWLDEVSEKAEQEIIDRKLPRALRYLKDIHPFKCVVFGCTSASVSHGPQGMRKIEADMARALGLSSEEIDRRIPHGARVWLDNGVIFGTGGEQRQRVSLSCTRATLTEALERVQKAFEDDFS